MREIEFRAWDLDEKTMHYVCRVSSFHGVDSTNGKVNRHDKRSWMTWDGNCYTEGRLHKYVMLQFTGLIDSKGQKIFEGDIVIGYTKDANKALVTAQVYWDKKQLAFRLKGPRTYRRANTSLRGLNSIEVIGNTYEGV